jgi:hypothetical protein
VQHQYYFKNKKRGNYWNKLKSNKDHLNLLINNILIILKYKILLELLRHLVHNNWVLFQKITNTFHLLFLVLIAKVHNANVFILEVHTKTVHIALDNNLEVLNQLGPKILNLFNIFKIKSFKCLKMILINFESFLISIYYYIKYLI